MTSLTTEPVRGLLPSGRVVRHQVKYELRAFCQSNQARFFTLAIPVSFLLLFVATFGNGSIQIDGARIALSRYYTVNMVGFSLVDTAFMALAITLVDMRETGILLRRKLLPQPSWGIVVSRAVALGCMSMVTAAFLFALSRGVYGVSVPVVALPELAVAILIGSSCLCALAFAVTPVIRSNQSATAMLMAMVLPLFFASGTFVPSSLLPGWLRAVGTAFPIHPLADALLVSMLGHGMHLARYVADLGILLAWGTFGMLLALRWFSWSPASAR